MNAAMLALALAIPGQTYVYQARPMPEPTPRTKAQHAKALAELRQADRYDQVARMIEDSETRLEWAEDKQLALVEMLGFESNRGTWGKPGEFRAPEVRGFRIALAVADEPRAASLGEFNAKQRELVRIEKQNRTLAWQRRGVRQHLDREAERKAMVEATKVAAAMRAFDR